MAAKEHKGAGYNGFFRWFMPRFMLIYIFYEKADKKDAMVNISKWARSEPAGIVYGVLSLVFLWMSVEVVDLYVAFPEYFANDAYFIFALLIIEAIVLYILFSVIISLHLSDKYKRLFNIGCVLFSSLFIVLPLKSFPAVIDAVRKLISGIS